MAEQCSPLARNVRSRTAFVGMREMIDVATLRMVTPPERRDEFLHALRWLAGPIRARAGCAGCRILQDLDDENALVFVEEWASREAFTRHLRSDDYRRLLALADLAVEPPEIQFDRLTERRGLDLVAEIRDGAGLCPEPSIRGASPRGEGEERSVVRLATPFEAKRC